ncbi:MAG: phage integrase N-terminal SAM-like domain-containing protein, partial [Anaerolineae bacterium]
HLNGKNWAISPPPFIRSSPMAKKLLDQLREVLRLKHYSYRTEQAYVDWVRRFITMDIMYLKLLAIILIHYSKIVN